MLDFTTLPDGIFKTLLEFWENIRFAYVGILSWFMEETLSIPGVPSLISLFFGTGVTVFCVFCIVRWIKNTLF